jgi:hypothetical protein
VKQLFSVGLLWSLRGRYRKRSQSSRLSGRRIADLSGGKSFRHLNQSLIVLHSLLKQPRLLCCRAGSATPASKGIACRLRLKLQGRIAPRSKY